MQPSPVRRPRPRLILSLLAAAVAAALAAATAPAQARVVRVVIDSITPVANTTPPYERVRGRAFGELDPNDPKNGVITDIQLGVDADGKLRYETTFTISRPVDMSKANGFMWHDVPNRGGVINPNAAENTAGDINLASGWQADNAGATAIPTDRSTGTNHWVSVPMARNGDQLVTGNVLARIVNRSGVASQALNVMGNPVPYLPATLDTTQAVLTTHTKETVNGQVTIGSVIAASDWAYGSCSAANPFPGTPQNISTAALPGSLPVHICLRNGFDANLLYQLVYPAKGAYILGAGIAAFRDVGAFFKYETQDDLGTPNPIAGKITASSMRGSSQSGNFTRQYIYAGMNQDEKGRIVHNGAWPQIAGRRVAAMCVGANPMACWSCTNWAAKARSGGPTTPTRCEATPRRASSRAATSATPAPK